MAKHKEWIETALFMASKFSKCRRAQYCCIFLNKLGHIVGAGYNGKPRGCDDGVCYRDPGGPGHACCIHAEDNAASWSDPEARQGGTAYVSGTPCDVCALRLLNSGVSTIVYYEDNSTCKTGHICNVVDAEFWKKFDNGTEVIAFQFEEEKIDDPSGVCGEETGRAACCTGQAGGCGC